MIDETIKCPVKDFEKYLQIPLTKEAEEKAKKLKKQLDEMFEKQEAEKAKQNL